ncbi:MAG: hypothetical protein HDT43_10810 [Ruminococcaceae bacterium]|nr:hypothetical protein [Oscillospiraceae bacterium]
MKLTKKLSKRAIVTLCAVGFAVLYAVYYILTINIRQMTRELNEQREIREAYETSVAETAKGGLHNDVWLYWHKNLVVDFTDEETERLLEAFDMVIPENEPNAKPRLLSTEDDRYYYLEFDGITDRQAFYDANKYDRKRYFKFSDTWNEVDDNGEYTNYFAVRVQFKSGDEELKSPYITKIKPLYQEIFTERLNEFKEQL